MNERRRLAMSGLISVAVALDADDRLRGGSRSGFRAFRSRKIARPSSRMPATAAAEAVAKGARQEDKLREAIRLAVRRCATDWTGKKPVVSVLIVRA